MARKELFKSLIALSQAELPFERIEREIVLPVQPELIINVPGVRRAGKSSLLMLTVNKLFVSGKESYVAIILHVREVREMGESRR